MDPPSANGNECQETHTSVGYFPAPRPVGHVGAIKKMDDLPATVPDMAYRPVRLVHSHEDPPKSNRLLQHSQWTSPVRHQSGRLRLQGSKS